MVKGIGIDLVHLPRLRAVIDRWQDRFLTRVFTEAEIAYCRARRDPVQHFAARFAAKEAGLKALGTGLRLGINWRELEVRRERGQAPVLELSGRSREIGLARGGHHMLLALTHDGDYAMAQAILTSEEAPPAPAEASPSTAGAGEAGARTGHGHAAQARSRRQTRR
ncbi:MAG: holo-ACP synthase [Candidatus Rokuibacteriota bacterium]